MAIPDALLEGAGDKILPLIWDDTGTNTPALFKGIYQHVLNDSDVAHMGIATHEDGDTWAAGHPIVVVGAADGSTARSLVANSVGELISASPAYAFGGNAHTEVAVGGTAVQFASHACERVIVSSDADNTTAAYLGTSAVTNDTNATTGGYQLDAGQQVTLDITNSNVLYVNGAAGVGVSYVYLT